MTGPSPIARPRRGGPARGAVALAMLLVAVLVVASGAIAAELFALAAEDAHAGALADGVAHDAEAQLMRLPGTLRDALSVDLQENAGRCIVDLGPAPDDHPDLEPYCALLAIAMARRVAADQVGRTLLLGLLVTADFRDERAGVAAGRLVTVAVVVVRRHLWHCGSADPPRLADAHPAVCWARAASSAHQA